VIFSIAPSPFSAVMKEIAGSLASSQGFSAQEPRAMDRTNAGRILLRYRNMWRISPSKLTCPRFWKP